MRVSDEVLDLLLDVAYDDGPRTIIDTAFVFDRLGDVIEELKELREMRDKLKAFIEERE